MKTPQILAFCALCLLGTSQAATLLTQLTAPTRTDWNGNVGIVFTVGSNDLNITALGYQDAGQILGLGSSHEVGIWDNAGNLVASVIVQLGTLSALDTNWRYESIAPTTLNAGETYTLGALTGPAGGDAWTDAGTSPGHSIDSDVTYVDGVYTLAGPFAQPTTSATATVVRWGPANMQYTVVVPEPSSTALLGLGSLALVLRRRKD